MNSKTKKTFLKKENSLVIIFTSMFLFYLGFYLQSFVGLKYLGMFLCFSSLISLVIGGCMHLYRIFILLKEKISK